MKGKGEAHATKSPRRRIKPATPGCKICLKAHAVKGIAKAMLSSVTNVKAARYEGAAYAPFFIDDAIWARRTMQLNGGRRLLSYHCCKETGEGDDGYLHIFLIA
jgi:hypothetical protein